MKKTSEKMISMDWPAYILQMETLLAVALDEQRRAALQQQFEHIAALAAPLMALPLDERQEIAGYTGYEACLITHYQRDPTSLHKGELSAQAIAQQTLDAITVANPLINAYTHITADRMLSEACRLDTLRAKGQPLPALAAVPYAVKNLFDVAGETTLSGASLFCDQAPPNRMPGPFHA